MDPQDVQKLGWVDEALAKMGEKRAISVFTRNYHVAMHLAKEQDLVVTLPTRAAELYRDDESMTILPPPFTIATLELKMIWSPLLHRDSSHNWLRQQVTEIAQQIS